MSAMIQNELTASVYNAFQFEVAKFPLSGPDGMKTPHYGLFRSDNAQCIGFACKKNYQPHVVDDIAALVDAAGSAFPQGKEETQVRCYWNGDSHVVSLAPSREYREAVYGTDTIWPRLLINAGYDGSAFKASLGFYRDACRNMAMIRSAGKSASASIKHSSRLWEKLDSLRQTFAQLANGWQGIVETAREMQSRELDLANFLSRVYPVADDATRRVRETNEQRIRKIISRMQRERLQLTGAMGSLDRATAWEAFNAVQGYVQHDQRRNGRPNEFARVLMAIDDSAVARAMELALAV